MINLLLYGFYPFFRPFCRGPVSTETPPGVMTVLLWGKSYCNGI